MDKHCNSVVFIWFEKVATTKDVCVLLQLGLCLIVCTSGSTTKLEVMVAMLLDLMTAILFIFSVPAIYACQAFHFMVILVVEIRSFRKATFRVCTSPFCMKFVFLFALFRNLLVNTGITDPSMMMMLIYSVFRANGPGLQTQDTNGKCACL
jgi:hypothetical protein